MYMGAGILPTALYKGKLWFLFGKENQFKTFSPGFSDFGGKSEKDESLLETAIREGGEELTGFLGSDTQLRSLLRRPYIIDNEFASHRTHIFRMEYDPHLVKYYNNTQQFIQKRLPASVIKSVRIFEKSEIRWICIDELQRMKPKFRHFYGETIDHIIAQQSEIAKFIRKSATRKNRE